MYKLLSVFLLLFSFGVNASVITTKTEYHTPIVQRSDYPTDAKCAAHATDAEVLLVDEASDFSSINSSSIRVFCVEPGDYTTDLDITQSGTASSKRYIRYYNSEETSEVHPANMDAADRAIIDGHMYFLSGVEHWIVDRISFDKAISSPIRMQPSAGNNIWLNRLLVENNWSNHIAPGGDFNVVQDSVLRNSAGQVGFDDIAIFHYGEDFKVVGNEIYNIRGDAIQVSNAAEGGVIAYNELYITDAVYTDCLGNIDTGGNCMCAENALDIKGGAGVSETFPFTDPVLVVAHNKMHGFNRNDDDTSGNMCGTGAGSVGVAVIIHGGVVQDGSDTGKGVIFRDNIITSGDNNIESAGIIGANPVSESYSFINNLIYDIDYALSMPASKTELHEWYYNTFLDILTSWHIGGGKNADFLCNVVINSPDDGVGAQGTGDLYDYNTYYNSDDTDTTNTNDEDYNTAAEAKNNSFTWIKHQITNPTPVTVSNAVTNSRSPHADICSGVSETASRGVDNETQLNRVQGGFIPSQIEDNFGIWIFDLLFQ